MAKLKLDEQYITLAEVLALFDFTLLKVPKVLYELYKYFFEPSDRKVNNDQWNFIKQLIGSLQPFADMANDFIATFTLYPSSQDANIDFLQPIFSLGNLLKGGIYIVTVSLIFPFFLIFFIPILFVIYPTKEFNKYCQSAVIIGLSWLIDGIGSLIRGATQLATTAGYQAFSECKPKRDKISSRSTKNNNQEISEEIQPTVRLVYDEQEQKEILEKEEINTLKIRLEEKEKALNKLEQAHKNQILQLNKDHKNEILALDEKIKNQKMFVMGANLAACLFSSLPNPKKEDNNECSVIVEEIIDDPENLNLASKSVK